MVPAIEDGWGMPEGGLRNDPSSSQRRLSSRSDGGVLGHVPAGAVGGVYCWEAEIIGQSLTISHTSEWRIARFRALPAYSAQAPQEPQESLISRSLVRVASPREALSGAS
jgi:hypothetical protein